MNYYENKKILDDLEKVLGSGQLVNFRIKNSNGQLTEVKKEEFAKWMENGKNVKTSPKESLVYGVSADIDGLTYFMVKKTKKESFFEPRKEIKTQIIKQNTEKLENNQPRETNLAQKDKVQVQKNKHDWKSKGLIWGGSIGTISLLALVVAIIKKRSF